jgi:Protein of unknown function (DUF732)
MKPVPAGLVTTVSGFTMGGLDGQGESVTMSGRGIDGGTMRRMKALRSAGLAVVGVVAAIGLSAPAYADPDTDFDNQIAGYGIYGPHDYNPYIAKIVCRRLGQGVDPDAAASAHFLLNNLPRGTTQVQSYQFLGSAISIYCPDLAPKLQNIPAR